MGSLFSGDAPSIPKPTDIFKVGKKGKPSVVQQQLTGVSGYYGQALPMFLGMAGQYTPQFLQQAFGFGGEALGGFTGLQREAGVEAAQQMADLRAQELGTMTGQTGLFRTLAGALSPEQQRVVEMEAAEAERATQAARGLTPEEQRGAEQRARESFGARGMLGSTGSVVAEALNRENVLAAKRAKAAGARGRSFDAASSFYTQPGLRMLGATPASYEAGTRLGAMGLELGQSLGPQLDYNLPLNLARERAGALDARNMAQYQADMQAKAERNKMIGNLIGVAAAPFTGGLSLGLTGLGGMMGGGGASGMMSGMSPAGMVNYRYV